MAKRDNDLFIGKEYLNIEGREIKHPSLIDHYATPSISKISEEPIDLMGIDIETDKDTGEMKLLGGFEPERGYEHFTPKSQELFAQILFSMIKYCKSEGAHIAYWNRLDPFQFFAGWIAISLASIPIGLVFYGCTDLFFVIGMQHLVEVVI